MTQPYNGEQNPAPIPSSPHSAYSPYSGSGAEQTYGHQSGPGAPVPSRPREAGFFRAIFDFSFEHFITVKFSSFLYVLAFIIAALYWVVQVITGVLMGFALGADVWTGEQGFNAVPLILAILFGWIPSVVLLIAMRLGLEFVVATVRTAQNTRRIADVVEMRP